MKRGIALILVLILILIGAMTEPLLSQKASRAMTLSKGAGAALDHTGRLGVNGISITFNNVGGLDEYTYPESSWEGWSSGEAMVYDQGLWITAKRNGSVGCLPYIWGSVYSPGPIINGRPAIRVNLQDSSRYRIYGITRGDTPSLNPDVQQWPSDLGAPIDAWGNPRIAADQMVYSVYNGIDTLTTPWFHISFYRNASQRVILPVEIHQIAYEHFGEPSDTSIWANTLFLEWAIYNRGPDPLDSVFLTLWSDIDFISSQYTIPAVDTNVQTAYCWYGRDSTFGAVGYTLLYGPAIPSPGDSAIFFGKKRSGYRNLPLSSFWAIRDDSYSDGSSFGPPYSVGTAWNVVRGLTQQGTPMIDSSTQRPTKFPYSGDPITGIGSVYPFRTTGGGGGFMVTTGPFSIAPGDSQWIMMALIPSAKWNGIDAINHMRASAQYLRSLPYDSLVTPKPRRNVPLNPLPQFKFLTSFELYQNYPNPFNGGTIIPFDLPEMSNVQIKIFDVLGRSVEILANQVLERGQKKLSWFPKQPSGVYFLTIKANSLESSKSWSSTKKLVFVK